jgi:hypothetical protein
VGLSFEIANGRSVSEGELTLAVYVWIDRRFAGLGSGNDMVLGVADHVPLAVDQSWCTSDQWATTALLVEATAAEAAVRYLIDLGLNGGETKGLDTGDLSRLLGLLENCPDLRSLADACDLVAKIRTKKRADRL